MGNLVGRAVKVDHTTMEVSRGRYARVCVEIDLRKQLVPKISLLGQPQPIEYEGLHMICFQCGKYGHKAEFCGQNEGGKDKVSEDNVGAPVGGEGRRHGPANLENETTQVGPFGPWMIPRQNGRRRTAVKAGGSGFGLERAGDRRDTPNLVTTKGKEKIGGRKLHI